MNQIVFLINPSLSKLFVCCLELNHSSGMNSSSVKITCLFSLNQLGIVCYNFVSEEQSIFYLPLRIPYCICDPSSVPISAHSFWALLCDLGRGVIDCASDKCLQVIQLDLYLKVVLIQLLFNSSNSRTNLIQSIMEYLLIMLQSYENRMEILWKSHENRMKII